eukprot:gene5991-1068_t
MRASGLSGTPREARGAVASFRSPRPCFRAHAVLRTSAGAMVHVVDSVSGVRIDVPTAHSPTAGAAKAHVHKMCAPAMDKTLPRKLVLKDGSGAPLEDSAPLGGVPGPLILVQARPHPPGVDPVEAPGVPLLPCLPRRSGRALRPSPNHGAPPALASGTMKRAAPPPPPTPVQVVEDHVDEHHAGIQGTLRCPLPPSSTATRLRTLPAKSPFLSACGPAVLGCDHAGLPVPQLSPRDCPPCGRSVFSVHWAQHVTETHAGRAPATPSLRSSVRADHPALPMSPPHPGRPALHHPSPSPSSKHLTSPSTPARPLPAQPASGLSDPTLAAALVGMDCTVDADVSLGTLSHRTLWKTHSGTWAPAGKQPRPVTVFSFSRHTHTQHPVQGELATNALHWSEQLSGTEGFPDTYAVFDTPSHFCIVTEPLTPLALHAPHIGTAYLEGYKAWGLTCTIKALSKLHSQRLVHGAFGLHCIFVDAKDLVLAPSTPSFCLLSTDAPYLPCRWPFGYVSLPFGSPPSAPLPLCPVLDHSHLLGRDLVPPEMYASGTLLESAAPHSFDGWGLGLMMWELFNSVVSPSSTEPLQFLDSPGRLPTVDSSNVPLQALLHPTNLYVYPGLHAAYSSLMKVTPSDRARPADLLSPSSGKALPYLLDGTAVKALLALQSAAKLTPGGAADHAGQGMLSSVAAGLKSLHPAKPTEMQVANGVLPALRHCLEAGLLPPQEIFSVVLQSLPLIPHSNPGPDLGPILGLMCRERAASSLVQLLKARQASPLDQYLGRVPPSAICAHVRPHLVASASCPLSKVRKVALSALPAFAPVLPEPVLDSVAVPLVTSAVTADPDRQVRVLAARSLTQLLPSLVVSRHAENVAESLTSMLISHEEIVQCASLQALEKTAHLMPSSTLANLVMPRLCPVLVSSSTPLFEAASDALRTILDCLKSRRASGLHD